MRKIEEELTLVIIKLCIATHLCFASLNLTARLSVNFLPREGGWLFAAIFDISASVRPYV